MATDDTIESSSFPLVVEELTQCVRLGNQSACEALIAKHPKFAPELCELVSTLQALAAWSNSEPHTEPGSIKVDSQDRLGQLGDFRLIRQLGQGGMGIVYEAEQISLQRRVAVKVLPLAGVLQTSRLERFKNEAKAAASLQHPHIVNAFFVGQERGVHFYAMRMIEGQTLAEIIASRPTMAKPGEGQTKQQDQLATDKTTPIATLSTAKPGGSQDFCKSVARIGIEAAQALQYAHALGIIHRDIKPSNLMIDQLGRTWVTDFGLASTRADGDLTLTGELLGTLRYMSPEQVAGQTNADERTDIYSLGATLYELLTGQPAVKGTSQVEIARQLADVQPTNLRSIDRAIPEDLERVVLKAMAKSPADRYRSAEEFEQDLRHFVDNKPVVARRPSALHKVWRWSQRNVVLAATISTLVLLLLFLAVAGPSVAWSYARLSKEESDAKQSAKAALERERETVVRQLQFLASTVNGTARALVNKPGFQDVQEKLLNDTVEHYIQLLEEHDDDPHVINQVGLAFAELRPALDSSFSYDRVTPLLDAAIKRMDFVVGPHRTNEEYKITLAGLYATRATRSHDVHDAQRAIDLVEEMIAAQPRPELNFWLSKLLSFYSGLLSPNERREKLMTARRAIEIGSKHGDDSLIQERTALAFALGENGELHEAEATFVEAIKLCRASSETADTEFVQLLMGLGSLLCQQHRYEDAIPLLKEGIEIVGPVVREFPEAGYEGYLCTRSWKVLGECLVCSGGTEEGLSFVKQWLDLPHNPSRRQVADFLWRIGENEMARLEYQRCINEDDGRDPQMRAFLLANCPDDSLRDPTAALMAANKAIELNSQHRHNVRATTAQVAAMAHYRCGNLQETIANANQAIQFRGESDAVDHFLISMAQAGLSDIQSALRHYRLGCQLCSRILVFVPANFSTEVSGFQLPFIRAEAESAIREAGWEVGGTGEVEINNTQ